jgi:hypothetical protein
VTASALRHRGGRSTTSATSVEAATATPPGNTTRRAPRHAGPRREVRDAATVVAPDHERRSTPRDSFPPLEDGWLSEGCARRPTSTPQPAPRGDTHVGMAERSVTVVAWMSRREPSLRRDRRCWRRGDAALDGAAVVRLPEGRRSHGRVGQGARRVGSVHACQSSTGTYARRHCRDIPVSRRSRRSAT